MRISDWSSDVCSSDLFNDYSNAFADSGPALAAQGLEVYAYDQRGFGEAPHRGLWPGVEALTGDLTTAAGLLRQRHPDQIGRAQVWPPVTNAHLVCRLLLETKTTNNTNKPQSIPNTK